MTVRIQAFSIRALVETPEFVLQIGDHITGFCEPTNGASRIAQLVSWIKSTHGETYSVK